MWWDREIPFGKSFDQVIDEALKNAHCIIVAWSTHAVKSDWVIEEAQYGRDWGILVPVLIENIPIPFGFRRIQAADLVDWNGKQASPVFQKLISDISERIGTPPRNRDESKKQLYISGWKAKFLKHPIAYVLFITIFVLFILQIVGVTLSEIFRYIFQGKPTGY